MSTGGTRPSLAARTAGGSGRYGPAPLYVAAKMESEGGTVGLRAVRACKQSPARAPSWCKEDSRRRCAALVVPTAN